MSRFGVKEVIDICGFEFPVYKSLLARERIAMLEAKSEAYDVALKVLQLRSRVAKILGVDEKEVGEAIEKVSKSEVPEEILGILSEIKRVSDPSSQQLQYVDAAINIFLRSRLDPSFIAKNIKDLKESFSFELSKEELAEYVSVPFSERLESKVVKDVCGKLQNLLPDQILEGVSDLLDAEFEGLTVEDFKAKQQPKPELENKDPKN
jgi:hypothetical protein